MPEEKGDAGTPARALSAERLRRASGAEKVKLLELLGMNDSGTPEEPLKSFSGKADAA